MSDFKDQLLGLMEKHGVSDYLIGYRDPDALHDIIEVSGSRLWRLGFAMDIIEETRAERRLNWDEEHRKHADE